MNERLKAQLKRCAILMGLALLSMSLMACKHATPGIPDGRYSVISLPVDFESRCEVVIDTAVGPQARRGYVAASRYVVHECRLESDAVALPVDFEARCGIALDPVVGPQNRSGWFAVETRRIIDYIDSH